MTKSDSPPNKSNKSQSGVLLRAQNGDIIGFDATGLRMNLADVVIENIQSRLDLNAYPRLVDAGVLGDIHAWDVRESKGWYLFHARLQGAQGIGQFRRRVESETDEPPAIIADPSHALYGIFSIAGARRGVGMQGKPRFPYHVLSTADDIGALGPAGTQETLATPFMASLPEHTADSLIADEILTRRMEAFRALPVIYVRSETDSSASLQSLCQARAMRNFKQTIANFCAAAASLDLPAKVLAVGLDFTLEAVEDDAASWLSGIYQLMQQITDIFAGHGLRKPLFVSMFDAGTQRVTENEVLAAQWMLAWNKGGHTHVFSAPTYMFELDSFGRATPRARQQMAEMDAFAIEALNRDQEWACPVFLLAERETDAPEIIRCRAQALGPLIIDAQDPLEAGKTCGFSLQGCRNGAQIVAVKLCPEDENDVLILCDTPPEGEDLQLLYAFKHPPCEGNMPANRGAIRDGWHYQSKTGATLHRWALPAALPVH